MIYKIYSMFTLMCSPKKTIILRLGLKEIGYKFTKGMYRKLQSS